MFGASGLIALILRQLLVLYCKIKLLWNIGFSFKTIGNLLAINPKSHTVNYARPVHRYSKYCFRLRQHSRCD